MRAAGTSETAEAQDPRWSALMAAAQAGDGAAYAALLREVLPLLRGLAAARCHEPAGIEPAVQMVLRAVHRLRATYDPARPFMPWLLAIAGRAMPG